MLRGYRSSLPVAAGMVPWPNGRVTLIAKLVLSLDANGVFVPTPGPIPPLQLDVLDDAAELLYPSDFAPYKPACDVLVVGAAVRHRGAGTLILGSARTELDALESLGPRQGFCPRGDPLDPSVVSLWTMGSVSPSRFQAAPPQRRLPWPVLPVWLSYERNGVRMSGQFMGPFPRAIVVEPDAMRVLARVPLVIDTLCLSPEHRRITVVYRGVLDRDGEADVGELVVLDFESTPISSLDRVDLGPTFELAESWSCGVAQPTPVEPRRRTGASDAGTKTAHLIGIPAVTSSLPFRAGPSSGRAPVGGQAPLSSAELEALRATRPVEHDWGASSTRLLSAAALVAPTAAAVDGASAGFNPERVREIIREMWKGERPFAEVLMAYGLTEAEWRVLRDKPKRL